MSDLPPAPGDASPNQADLDPGQPVAELAGLAEEPSRHFVANVLDGINRRQTFAQALDLAWWGLARMLMEFVQGILHALGVREEKDKED